MDSPESIEAYLIRSEHDYEEIGEGMWIVHDEFDEVDNIVIQHSSPVVLFRVKLMDAPTGDDGGLYKRLLELNANEMVAGAYGLEDGAVVATETLQSENLDYNEFQAALDGLTLAITEHYQDLKQFVVAPSDRA